MDSTKTRVIFRTVKRGGDVVAVFPDSPEMAVNHFMCYQHIGQHGSCSFEWYRSDTRPATEAEIAPLLCELQGMGYVVKAVKRMRGK